ncbi:MAG: PIN domain-containing protein [Nostocales cyanobacterium ELA583]
MVLSVILDSCVIYPMPLCDTLMRAAEAGLYEFYFSQEILDGATRNLVKKERMVNAKEAHFQKEIKKYFPNGMVEVPDHLITAMTNDPGDHHVVAAAIVAKAEVIVTANLDDFAVEALAPYDIEAWHPDDFLLDLDEQFPGKMITLIQQQSEALKTPPITTAELLDKLEKDNTVPKFARSIRCQMYSQEIVQTAKIALNILGKAAPEGGRCYEGKWYRIWEKGKILTITAKDNRCEILRFENGGIGGYLSSEDVQKFQKFAETLEQKSEELKTQKSEIS